jgi:hypothetical protein
LPITVGRPDPSSQHLSIYDELNHVTGIGTLILRRGLIVAVAGQDSVLALHSD